MLRVAALAMLGLVVLVTAPLAVLLERGSATDARPAGSGIPATYMPIYAVAERVNRWLLASIHFQETRFSTLRAQSLVGDAVTSGWNDCGAAGPMQMGVVAGNSLGGGVALTLGASGRVASVCALSPIGFATRRGREKSGLEQAGRAVTMVG